MHVDYVKDKEDKIQSAVQSANFKNSKCQNGTLKITLEELALLNCMIENPRITQMELAEKTGKSTRTIKREMTELFRALPK